jgi:protein SCO1/2
MRARTAAFALAGLALAAAPAFAQQQYGELPMPERTLAAGAKAGILKDVGIDQRIGQQLPLDLTFKDESGRDVTLGQYFGGTRPVVMALAYYQCPMLCSQVLRGMVGSLKTLSFNAGKDFDIVVVSIDPRDGFREAANQKAMYLREYGRQDTAAGFHFLTGTDASIKPLAKAIGFRYVWDPMIEQFAHGSAIYVATPKGVIARYFMGIEFAPRDLRLSLVEASNNQLGSVADQVLLLCYHYDPSTGKYGAATINAVRVGFILTLTALLSFVFVSLRRERQAAQHRDVDHDSQIPTRI